MNEWFWVWLLLAIILAVAEVLSPGFFLLPFAIGAAIAAGLEYFAPGSIGLQWIAFVGVSSVLLVVVQRRKLAKRKAAHAAAGPAGTSEGTPESAASASENRTRL